MARSTDRLDVTHTTGYEDDGRRDGITFCGLPIYVSRGQRLRDDFLLGLSPHTIHNLAVANKAQTCDLAYARDAVSLYDDEMWEALADKKWQAAWRASMRRAVFEARERELVRAGVGVNMPVDWPSETHDNGETFSLPSSLWYERRYGSQVEPGMLVERYVGLDSERFVGCLVEGQAGDWTWINEDGDPE